MGITSVLLPPSRNALFPGPSDGRYEKFDISRSNVMLAEEENLPKVQKIFDTLTAEGMNFWIKRA